MAIAVTRRGAARYAARDKSQSAAFRTSNDCPDALNYVLPFSCRSSLPVQRVAGVQDVICLPCRALQLIADALIVILCCPCRHTFPPLSSPFYALFAKQCAGVVPCLTKLLLTHTLTGHQAWPNFEAVLSVHCTCMWCEATIGGSTACLA